MSKEAPGFRIWPPVALGVPLLGGIVMSKLLGDPFPIPRALRPVGWVLVAAFALWNGWALALIARSRTAILPGGATCVILARGPFGVSRNPLYLGLIALDVALALLMPSAWALVAVPVGVLVLTWGAIVPEERYL